MTPEQRGQIQNFADQIREALNMTSPVEVEEMVSKLGGRIEKVSSKEIEYEACIQKLDDGFKIVLAKDLYNKRTRFSIAHEIGHLFLHMGYIVDEDKWNKSKDYKDNIKFRFGYSEEELQANEFAAALLMPKDEFKKVALDNFDGKLYNLSGIANHFDVSLQAAKTRGRWLGLFSWD